MVDFSQPGLWWVANPFVGEKGLALAERAGVTLLQIHGHYPEMGRY